MGLSWRSQFFGNPDIAMIFSFLRSVLPNCPWESEFCHNLLFILFQFCTCALAYGKLLRLSQHPVSEVGAGNHLALNYPEN